MTVSDLRLMLKGLPANMTVVMSGEEATLITVCKEQSGIIVFEGLDEVNDEEIEEEEMLLLVPCTCHIEKEVDIVEPNLN